MSPRSLLALAYPGDWHQWQLRQATTGVLVETACPSILQLPPRPPVALYVWTSSVLRSRRSEAPTNDAEFLSFFTSTSGITQKLREAD